MSASDPSPSGLTEKLQRAIEPLLDSKRRWTLGVLLALTALFAFESLQLRWTPGFDQWLPSGHPAIELLEQYRADFGGADTLMVALVRKGGDIYDAPFLGRLKSATDELLALPGMDRARVSSLFTADVRFVEVIDGGFKGGAVIPPEYASTPTPAMLETIRANVLKGGHVGRYVSDDGRGAMIFAELRETDPATGARLDYAATARKLEELRLKYRSPDVSVYLVGFAPTVGDRLAARDRVRMFGGLALALVFAVLWLGLGSVRLALPPLLAAITAVIWEFGLLRICGYGIDPFALYLPWLIFAISLSHGVQFVGAWAGAIAEAGSDANEALQSTWRRLARWGAAAILANLAAFATLGFVAIAGVREIALGACLGLAAILCVNLLMMPTALRWIGLGDPRAFAAAQASRDARFERIARSLTALVRPRAAMIVVLTASALFGAALWQGRGLQLGDAPAGAPGSKAVSRDQQDARAIGRLFSTPTDVLRVVAETEAESCVKFEVMDQIDRLAWRLDNTAGVQSTASLPQAAKAVNAAFAESNPKYEVLPRNQYTLVQAITPIPASSGLLNSNCSAMAVLAYLGDHRASTVDRVVETVRVFGKENASAFYETNKDVSPKYCEAKLAARRAVGRQRLELQQRSERVKAAQPSISDEQLQRDAGVVDASAGLAKAQDKVAGLTKVCPVNFTVAGGNAGAIAASNEVVGQSARFALLSVLAVLAIGVYLCFFEWTSLVAIVLPLSLVAFMVYALMALTGIGLGAANLPIAALAAGLGLDAGVYLYATMKGALAGGYGMQAAYAQALKRSGRAVIVTGLGLTIGAAVWLGSGLPSQRELGLLLIGVFAANLVGAIVLLPGIAALLLRARVLEPGETPAMPPRY